MRPSLLVVVFLSVPLIATAAVVKGRIRVSAAAGEAVMFGAVLSATAAYLLWLASPSLLPVTIGPDVVHHLQLIHLIQRTHRLAHDSALQPYLLEMMNYTPGSHILAASVADWLSADALRVVQPVTAMFTAVKMGMLYLIAIRIVPGSRAAPLAAVAAPLLAFAPAVYTIGSTFHFFFYAQVVSEAFAIGMLLAVVCWTRTHAAFFIVAFAACGVGLFLCWPVWLGPAAGTFAIALLSVPLTWSARARAAVAAFAPMASVVLLHSALHAQDSRILSSSGAVTSPSVAGFGMGFLICAAAGVVLALRLRPARLVAAFLAITLVQAVTIAVLDVRAGSRGFYMPFKMVYLAVFPCALLGAAALITLTDALIARVPRARALAAAPVLFVLLGLSGRVPMARQKSPINEPSYRAGLWAREHLDRACIDYFSRHWLTGYWLHLDVLGNARDSDRMRQETFEFRDSVGKWLEGRGLRYGFVEHVSDIPRELRGELRTLQTFSSAALLENPKGRCP